NEQSLITVESDKASMEIPSSAAGVLKELKVKVGDKINQGDLIAIVQGQGAARAEPAEAQRVAGPSTSSGQSGPSTSSGRTEAERVPPTAALPPHEPAAPSGSLPHA